MVIIVTGGIGSGKSEVCALISRLYSIPLYEADSRVKGLYGRYPDLVGNLEVLLGCGLRDDEGNFVPSMLAARIFGDHGSLLKVEDMVFPYLKADFSEFLAISGGHVIFESATVLEKEAFKDFGDAVILVDAPVTLRLERACHRDGADKAKIMARMDSQRFMNMISDGTAFMAEEYATTIKRITAKILNTGTLQELEQKVRIVMDDILQNV